MGSRAPARSAGLRVAVLAALAACSSPIERIGPPAEEAADPPEAVVGERLFRETRFAQFFAARSAGDVNRVLARGDPALDVTVTTEGELPGPYRGQSMNCAACHLVDELDGVAGGGVRTYADFAVRSPIPAREDGRTIAPRNSPALVEATASRAGVTLLHFDGEFTNPESLVRGTLTGRNYGWLPEEAAAAVAQVAAVMRGDDGQGLLAARYGSLSYETVLRGTATEIPPELRLPVEYRIDVQTATDDALVGAVSRLVAAYLRGLAFSRDADGRFDGSAFDLFLARNDLPRAPLEGESPLEFAERLRKAIESLANPRFVTAEDGRLERHLHEFGFGPQELAGARIFLARGDRGSDALGVGNCVACHHLPSFTDGGFHNVGTAQEEYDAVFGEGAFAALDIPRLAERNADPDRFLPPSRAHPRAQGRFLAPVSAGRAGYVDLGLWNVAANPELPEASAAVRGILCAQSSVNAGPCSSDEEDLVAAAIARFKTPNLRDLGQSAPYMHTGMHRSLEAVVEHYVEFGALARSGRVRNADSELAAVQLSSSDVAPLAAFLRSLDEDYD